MYIMLALMLGFCIGAMTGLTWSFDWLQSTTMQALAETKRSQNLVIKIDSVFDELAVSVIDKTITEEEIESLKRYLENTKTVRSGYQINPKFMDLLSHLELSEKK